MYFNDVHILYYVIFGLLGGIIGQIIEYSSKMFIEEKKIISKQNFNNYIKTIIPNYYLIFTVAIIYITLIYCFGVTKSILEIIDLTKYIIITPILICAFIVDFKRQIIPNRLNLLLLEIGLISVFAYGFFNLSIAMNMLFGMLAGGAIFLFITLIGGLIAGKEAMGLRRCKINGGFRTIFWTN